MTILQLLLWSAVLDYVRTHDLDDAQREYVAGVALALGVIS